LRYSRAHLNEAAHHLNKRPRKTLEFETRRSGLTAVLRRPVEIAWVIDRLRLKSSYPEKDDQ